MTATTTVVIAGVSVLARGREPGQPFDLGLSPAGVEIRRPGQPIRHMSWSRVSEWELEQRAGDVVLTLRGDGATTPLLITGWSLDDLEALMRSVTDPPAQTTESVATVAVHDEPVAAEDAGEAAFAVAVVRETPETEAPAAVEGRRERRRSRRRIGWQAVVTIALMVVVGVAVALVLLQSAGVIHWGFLGPTA